ncbi:Smr/MutS family protein [Chitinibacter tainanensis]|uniref:Smr/MutS family protein n=1 Tax=Chitinibacter tainanensis TaxID=230667 RepID=UPI000419ED33|nr:Smr/MutS family protein [Chitinibacter tainanensis]
MDKKTIEQLKQLRKNLRSAKATPISPPKPSEAELFARAMQGVQPLAQQYIQHAPRHPSPWPRQQAAGLTEVIADMSDFWPWDELEPGESLHFVRPGLRVETIRKLRRGDWPVESELDLHGENIDSARPKVAQFLSQSVARRLKCVRIIHGKGLSSPAGQPILKLKLKNWLAQRDEVLAYTQASPQLGSAGAVLILLRSAKK